MKEIKFSSNIANTKDKYIRLRVTEEEHNYLKELVKRKGCTLSDLIRIALDKVIEEYKEEEWFNEMLC